MVIKGNIISADRFGEIRIIKNGYIVIKDEKIANLSDILPFEYKDDELIDYGNKLIFQAFSDMHLHAPQFPMLGMGYDLELLDWLNTYTFPTEAKFSNVEYAKKTYKVLAKELIKNGTTRVAMFSSLHKDSTLILMDELDKAGISGYVGKVNMDRNGGVDLEEDTDDSINDTIDWIKKSNFKNIRPIITPRFIPSCTPKLLKALGEIAEKYDLKIQSHLSENISEINLVKSLENVTEYYKAYEKYGLWNNKTLMAHCVHSSEEEIKSLRDNGVYVVHCASSNNNLTSGYARIRYLLNNGVKVVLGSDIAAGDKLSMFDNVVETIKASKARVIIGDNLAFLTPEEAFYLATSAANEFFGEKPGFAVGNKFNAIVLDDSDLLNTEKLSIKERFERMFYLREEDAIKVVYSNGKAVYNSKN